MHGILVQIPLPARGPFAGTGVAATIETCSGRPGGPARGHRRRRSDACSGDMLLEALLACAGR